MYDDEFIDIEERYEEFLRFWEESWREELRAIAHATNRIAFFDWDGVDTRERIYPDFSCA